MDKHKRQLGHGLYARLLRGSMNYALDSCSFLVLGKPNLPRGRLYANYCHGDAIKKKKENSDDKWGVSDKSEEESSEDRMTPSVWTSGF